MANEQEITVNGKKVKIVTNSEVRPGYSPYIGDNGNWYIYDVTVKGFIDTNIPATGETGNGVASITKTGTSGLADTYTISYTDGTSTTFIVTNGNGITAITKTGTSGNVDTYTINYNDGTTTTFTVTNVDETELTDLKSETNELKNGIDTINLSYDVTNKRIMLTLPEVV